MGSIYSWVRHDWCPACFRTTEQERRHTGRVPGEPRPRWEAHCRECDQIVPPPSLADVPGFPPRESGAVDNGAAATWGAGEQSAG